MVDQTDRRRFERFTVPPMLSSVQVVRGPRCCEGHVYDVGLGGMRFELDAPLPKGAEVSVEITLPGCAGAICAKARVVRVFAKSDDPGPRRMAVEFESFSDAGEAMLSRYLGQKWLRRAPDQDERTQAPMRVASVSRSSGSVKTRSASAA